jgi:hypothetical protein
MSRGEEEDDVCEVCVLSGKEREADGLCLQCVCVRFGSFVETRRLPQDADVEGLQATYEGGVLRVTVPRLYTPPAPVRRPQPHPFGAPMGGYPYGNRGGAGFWGDPDVWW